MEEALDDKVDIHVCRHHNMGMEGMVGLFDHSQPFQLLDRMEVEDSEDTWLVDKQLGHSRDALGMVDSDNRDTCVEDTQDNQDSLNNVVVEVD